jgi:hypothetical protein
MFGRQERHDPFAWDISAEIRDEVAKVVFFRGADGAVRQKDERAAFGQPTDRVVGVDPGVHPFARGEFRLRRPQLRGDDRLA